VGQKSAGSRIACCSADAKGEAWGETVSCRAKRESAIAHGCRPKLKGQPARLRSYLPRVRQRHQRFAATTAAKSTTTRMALRKSCEPQCVRQLAARTQGIHLSRTPETSFASRARR
jgi:hypothetical protein